MIAEQDKALIANRYEPILVIGKAPAAEGWRDGEITAERIAAERETYPDATGTGLRTGPLVGVDLDIVEADHLQRFVDLAYAELGETTLIRRGNKGWLMAYRNDTPLKKITARPTDKAKAAQAKVELLGSGQQFVAFGLHPDTGKPYEWLHPDPDGLGVITPLDVPFNTLPSVTPDKLRSFAGKVAGLLTELGYGPAKVTGDMGEDRAEPSERSGTPVAEKVLREALSCLEPGCGRDGWRDVIAGIRAADITGDDDGKIARLLACEWSRGALDRQDRYADKTPQNYVDDNDVLAVFETMPPREGGVTVATLFKQAQDAGWEGNPFDAGRSAAETFAGAKLPVVTSAPVVPGEPPRIKDPSFPDLNNFGLPKATPLNTRLAVKALGIDCRYDRFHDKLSMSGYHISQWQGEVSDNTLLALRPIMRDQFCFEPSSLMLREAVVTLCQYRQFDPVCDYLDGLQWDGVKRLDTWLADYMGAPDTPFVRAVGRIVLVAAVRRARRPGTKFDQIVVLEGREGINKSTAVKVLAGADSFSDQTILTVHDKEQQELLRGVWFYEIADLTGISKADTDKVKAFASRDHDRARPAFGHFVESQPRRCVFFATTNDREYLKSRTGNRRFWPVPTTEINLDRLRQNRDQLFAEAAQLETQGASIVLPKELWEAAAAEQDKRLEHDPWEDKLAGYSSTVARDINSPTGYAERVSSSTLFDFLKIPADRWYPPTAKRLRYVMERLGWIYKERLRVGSNTNGGYWRPADPPQELPDDADAVPAHYREVEQHAEP